MSMLRSFVILLGLLMICCQSKVEEVFTAPKPLKIYEKDGVLLHSYDFDGLQHFLQHENDTTYIVNFWATWCKPCVEELPYFQEFYEKNKNSKLQLYLVSLDFPKMVESGVIPFITKNQLTPKVIHLNDPDANRWIPLVNEDWTGAIPATVIYNRSNRAFYEKAFTLEELKEAVKTVMNK